MSWLLELHPMHELHGFPDWWGDRPRGGRGPGRNETMRGVRCSRGRGINNAPVHANKATTGTSSNSAKGGQSHALPNSGEPTVISGITLAQWQQLLDTLNVPKTKDRLHGKNDIPWIIDTGASHHVTGNLSSLINVKKITNIPVGLSDGKDATTTKEGSVILDGGLQLDNVLFVPQLTCNLISVSQLIDASNCIVQFTNALCVIQDRKTRTLIGEGERIDGLYFFRVVPKEPSHLKGEMRKLEVGSIEEGGASVALQEEQPQLQGGLCGGRDRATMVADEGVSVSGVDGEVVSPMELMGLMLWRCMRMWRPGKKIWRQKWEGE
ncbi:hypothetical protein SESBI_01976 [Sesbania bispinosa]|nr:hypothetical protein SESBI_01976 [Sesbania bispinosa]